jgi:hypothetical protein
MSAFSSKKKLSSISSLRAHDDRKISTKPALPASNRFQYFAENTQDAEEQAREDFGQGDELAPLEHKTDPFTIANTSDHHVLGDEARLTDDSTEPVGGSDIAKGKRHAAKTSPAVPTSSSHVESSSPQSQSVQYNAYTNKNWRENRETDAERQLRWARQLTIGLDAQTLAARRSEIYGTNGTRGSKVCFTKGSPQAPGGSLHVDQTPGVICWHQEEVRVRNLRSVPKGSEETMKPDGTIWTRKGRYFIIVQKNDVRIFEFRIYSYHNTGLNYIPRGEHPNYFAICPLNVQERDLKNKKTGRPILKIDWEGCKSDGTAFKLDRLTMHAKWTEVVERDINEDPLQICAKLSDESRELLIATVHRPPNK